SEAFPAVVERLQNHDESVREHAILALGYMEVEGVDALLAEILKEEPLAALRLQAAIAFEGREMTMANLQAQILELQRDPVKKIRLKVLNNIWLARERYPLVRGLVEKVAKTDSDKSVREAALACLAQVAKE